MNIMHTAGVLGVLQMVALLMGSILVPVKDHLKGVKSLIIMQMPYFIESAYFYESQEAL